MKPEYAYSEQSEGSQVIDIILTDGNKEKVLEKDVLQFIEFEALNIKQDYFSCVPGNYDYEETETDPYQYLDDNFEHVCKLYYKHLIEKR